MLTPKLSRYAIVSQVIVLKIGSEIHGGTYISFKIDSEIETEFTNMSARIKIGKDHQIMTSLVKKLGQVVNIEPRCNFVLYPSLIIEDSVTYL